MHPLILAGIVPPFPLKNTRGPKYILGNPWAASADFLALHRLDGLEITVWAKEQITVSYKGASADP